MQQLEELTESDTEMRNVHAKLEQQSQALQTMQETFEAVEAEKAEEHEQALSRSDQPDVSMTASVTVSMPVGKSMSMIMYMSVDTSDAVNTLISGSKSKQYEAVMHKQGCMLQSVLQISSYTV